MCGRVGGCMYVQVGGWVGRCKNVRMCVCMYVCMCVYVCMYVCII